MRVGSHEKKSSMKTLLLMRHAKSSWKQVGLADHEWPLNMRAKGDAPRMGNLLWERDLVPELILCSTALRARRTAEIVAAYPAGIISDTATNLKAAADGERHE